MPGLQALDGGIELDKDLIADCRSGEIQSRRRLSQKLNVTFTGSNRIEIEYHLAKFIFLDKSSTWPAPRRRRPHNLLLEFLVPSAASCWLRGESDAFALVAQGAGAHRITPGILATPANRQDVINGKVLFGQHLFPRCWLGWIPQ